LFYLVWKYLFLWQLDQPASGDTGGLFFPKAIQHMFVGLYIQQVCLAALFFLLKKGRVEGGLTIALILITIFFHMLINNSYGPLLHSLPLTLAHKSYGMPQTGEQDEEIGDDESADFGGEESPDSPSDLKKKETVPPKARPGHNGVTEESRVPPPIMTGGNTGLQHNQGPGPSAEYGASVPVEGKRNEGPTDFNHPASVEPQRIIWIPQDPLGLGEAESSELMKDGIESSTENATMDAKGHVDIQGHPPGSDPNTLFG
jgi:hypothetical protein